MSPPPTRRSSSPSAVPIRWLRAQGVDVDALFFPRDHDPSLGHEYQLLLSTDADRLAFDRAVAFLTARAK
jgi:acetyl esterase